MHSLLDDQLKERIFEENHALHVHNKASKIKWKTRSGVNKAGKLFYRLYRAFYVAVIFYFQPFLLMFGYKYLVEQGKYQYPAH